MNLNNTTTSAAAALTDQLIETFQQRRSLRAGSLIISVYGDAIAPHGGTIWLGSLIKLLEPLGISSRLVRTSVYRLSKENWLQSEALGRRSYYSLTSGGRRRFEAAYQRVYATEPQPWDGQWCLIFADLPSIDNQQRERIRHELLWQGFGALAPWVLIHPGIGSKTIWTTLEELGAANKVMMMTASSEEFAAHEPLQELVDKCWDLAKLAEDYQRFLFDFGPLLKTLQEDNSELDPQRCFHIRTLLIHQYRRVLLRDPQLPAELLSEAWAGTTARELCRNLYRTVQTRAEQHLLATAEAINGPLAPAESYFYERFGGL